jgi:hypothetical protein
MTKNTVKACCAMKSFTCHTPDSLFYCVLTNVRLATEYCHSSFVWPGAWPPRGQEIGASPRSVGFPFHILLCCSTTLGLGLLAVTSIQKLLGHRRLNSTMVYARVHDQTAADDYCAAMEAIEQRLALADDCSDNTVPDEPATRDESQALILGLADQLADPGFVHAERRGLVEQLRLMLMRAN